MDNPNKNIINSFKVQEELNPNIWYLDGENYKMIPSVRVSLLDIVKDYSDFVDLELDIDDVTLTGSLSNFNWSEFSDVDLHILMDLDSETNPLLKKYLDSRRMIWNSLLYDEWIVEPKKEEVVIDTKKILSKSKNWMDIIDQFYVDSRRQDPDTVLSNIDKFKNKIKNSRGSGLKDKGEYSYENLTFKFLRRNEYLKKLNDVRNYLIDKNLTLEGNVSHI